MSKTPWRCIHDKCGKLAYYITDVNWWDEKKGIGGTVSNPTAIPEGSVISFNPTAYREYPDKPAPKMKECPCYSCGELIPMYPDKGVITVEWDEPDWYGYFCDVLKHRAWVAADAVHDLVLLTMRKQFAKMPESLKEKFEAVKEVERTMIMHSKVFKHKGYIEHDERKNAE